MNGPDDAGQRRQHADLLGFADGTGGRWLRIEAAVATSARLKHGHLSLDAKDAAVHQRFSKQIGGITEQIAGAKGIGAVDDHVVAAQQ